MTWKNGSLTIVLLLTLVGFLDGNVVSSANSYDATTLKFSRTAVAAITLNLMDFGAVGDGVTDDGPALQAALNALADSGGGTLFVPAGHYALITPVAKNFSGLAASVVIVGETPFPVPESDGPGRGLGLSSEFVVKAGETAEAIAISGLENFLMQDIAFIGVETVLTDARTTLLLVDVKDATIRHCEFYGLASFAGGGAIVNSYHSNLKIHDAAFLGCATNSAITTSVVQVNQWQGFTITGTRFIDYGNRAFFGKTPGAAPYSWIMIGGAATRDAASAWREVVIRDVFLDEGAYIGLSLRPDLFAPSAPVDLFFISGLGMNVTNLGAYGHYLVGARRLFIEDAHYGWSHNSSGAMYLSQAGEAILDEVECVDGAYRISADSGTEKLTVVNSIYQELASQAQVTNVLNTDPDEDPVEIVRQQFLTATGQEPEPAALFYWTSQLLKCGADTACKQQTGQAQASFLAQNPSARFTLTGQVSESDGAPVLGATVTLNNSVSVQTDSDGLYSFANLPTSGSYEVAAARSNYSFTPASQVVTTPLGNHVLNFVGDMHTYDLNGYLIYADGQGIPNITVQLLGPEIRTVTSDSTGQYNFDDVRAEGPYVIKPESPFFSFEPGSITLNGLNQNTRAFPNIVGTRLKYTISGATGLPDTLVTLSGDGSGTATTGSDGLYTFTVDAGLNYTITPSKAHYNFLLVNRVFTELSGDQTNIDFTPELKEYTISGNAGVAEVTISISGGASATTLTDTNGAYSFTVEALGNYTVTASKTHYTFSPPTFLFTDLSGDVTANFVPKLNTHQISGNAGLAGVTISLSGSASTTTVTDANGAYSITVNAGGNYTLTPAKTHYTFSPLSQSFTDVSGNLTANFVPTIKRYAISGSAGTSGVVINIGGSTTATVVTDANGAYSITVNAGGNYTVTPAKTHYTFSPPPFSFSDLSGNVTANFVPKLNTHQISGNAGLAGVTISLGGSAIATTVTDASGAYSITVNAGGNYTVTPSKTYYTFLPATRSVTDLGGNVAFDFTPVLNKHIISGNAGAGGTTVVLSGSASATAVTDASGAYSFTVDAGGNYTLTPNKPLYKFSPVTRSFTNVNDNLSGANFAASQMPALLTELNSTNAIALDSVTWAGAPFSLSGNHLSADGLTRIMLFATNISLPGGNNPPITAQAEDSQQQIIPLTVEYVGKVPNYDWLVQINVKLPNQLQGNQSVWITITVNGETTNKALILLKP